MRRTLLIATLCVQGFIIVSIGQILRSDPHAERAGCSAPVGMNTIHGTIYEDDNSDGIQNGLESDLNGITLRLYDDADSNNIPDGAVLKTTISDANGEYNFDTTLVYSQPFTYDQRIPNSQSDAFEELGNGDVKETDKDVKVGKGGNSKLGGFRYLGLNIPATALIDSAFLYFDNGEGKADNSSVDIYGEDDASPRWYVDARPLSTRSRTTEYVTMDFTWGANATNYKSPDLKNIVQEVVDNHGAIERISFLLPENANSDDEVKIMAWDDQPSKAARLAIYYTVVVSNPYHFLVDVDPSSRPAGSSLTTATYQSAAFYASDVAECNNDFGLYVGNKPPIANDDAGTTIEDQSTVITVAINDVDPNENLDPASISITSAPTTGTAIYNAIPEGVLYTPDPGSYGRDTFSYQICDDGTPALCDEAEVIIFVACDPGTTNITETICFGSSVTVGSSTYSTTGIHTTVINNEFCDSVVILDLTVDELPAIAAAGPDQTLCNTSTFTMAANNPAVGSGQWSLVSGSATITTPSLRTTTVTGVTAGNSATLRWTVSNGVCPPSTDDITIRNDQLPTTADAGPVQTLCNTSSFTMAANNPVVGSGQWSVVSGTATITTPSSPVTTITGVAAGTSVTLRWTITNGVCTPSTEDVVVQNYGLPIAAAGPDQTLCNTSTFTMAANASTFGSGTWTIITGSATITSPSSPTSTITGVTAGTSVTLRWTVSNGVCSDATDDLTIQNDQLPTASAAGPDQTLCNTSTFTIAANSPAMGTGAWSVVSGSASITNAASPTTTITGVTAGSSATLRWAISNGICESSTDDVTVQNDQLPTTAAAGPDQTLCNASTFTMAANNPIVGSGLWSVVSGTAMITTPSSRTTAVTGVTPGNSATLRWTISNGVCASSTDDITIQNDAPPSTATAGINQTNCNDPDFTMTAISPAMGTGSWSVVSGSATITTPSSPTTTVTGVPSGSSATLRWTVSNGVCPVSIDDITLQNAQLPTTSIAGTDQTLCNTTTFNMAANSPAIGSGLWSVVSGTATITTPSSPTTSITGVAAGTSITLRWTISNGACPASTDDITIQHDGAPVAAAGPDQTLCNTSSFTMAANNPAFGSGSWTIISGTASINSPASPSTTVTGVTAGSSVILRWTVSNGVCSDAIDDITVQNDQLPTISAAGPDQTLCNTSTFAMAANNPVVGSGQWSVVSGTAAITTPGSRTTTVTGVAAGSSVTLRWTVSNGLCTSSTDDITIQNDQLPTASAAGPDQTLCNTSTFTMAANNPAVGTGQWSVVSGTATITTPSSRTTTVTGVTAGNSATLRWTISNGVCTASTDDVTINNEELATIAAAGPDQTFCNTSTFTMAANTPVVGTGAWSIVSGSATITTTLSPTTTITGVAAGSSVTLRWTVTNGVCTPSTDDITIQNDALPTASVAGPDQTLCNTATFTMAANNPVIGTGQWSVVSGTATITTPSSRTTTVTGVTAGNSATLRWTISNGSCTASADDVTIQNDQLPTVSAAGPDQTLCNTSSFTMAANNPAVGSGQWSVVSGTANITNPSSRTTTVNSITSGNSVTLRWTISNGVCANSTDDVTVQNDQLPTVSTAGPDQTLCNTSTFTMAANNPVVGSGLWSVVSGTATITTPSSRTTTVTGVAAESSVTLRWTISNGVCAASTDDVTVQNDGVPASSAGPDQALCNTSTFTMNAAAPAVGSGLWSVVSGTATITNPSSRTTTVTGVASGSSSTLRWTVSNGVCSNAIDDVTIQNDQLPAVSAAGPDQTICNTFSFTMAANTPAIGTGSWSLVNGTATITNPSSPTTTITGISPGPGATLRWTISNGVCAVSTDDISVVNSNCPPAAVDDAASTPVDIAVSIDVLANDSDPEGHALNISSISSAPNHGGSTVINNNGTPGNPSDDYIVFTPSGGYMGVETFEYTTCDDRTPALCDVATVSVTITNTAPTANDDSRTTDENVPAIINVVVNDTDAENNLAPSTVVITQTPASGSITNISALGVVTYTPNLNFFGVDVFKYDVDDALGLTSNEATVTITVIENLPPVAADDNITTTESTPVVINVFSNDSDPNGDLNIYSATTSGLLQPAHGSVTLIPGTGYLYTPVAGYEGFDQFEYQVCDSSQFTPLCDIATVSIFMECDGSASGQSNEIRGLVYYDENANGNYEAGEVGFEGAGVYLYLDADDNNIPDGPAIETAITTADGSYDFVLNLTYGVEYSYNQRIQHGKDDAHEETNGDVKENDRDIKVGKRDKARHGGFRFTNLNLPANTVIDSAYIFFDNGDKERTTSLNIHGELSAAPQQYDDGHRISTRPRTGSFTKFDIDWARDERDYQTPDVSVVMQEVIDNVGAINEFSFILANNADSDEEAKILAYNDKPAQAARLLVYYTVPGNGPFDFLTGIEPNSLPATSVVTTAGLQSASFMAPATAYCNNNFGFDIIDLSPNVSPVAVNDIATTVADVDIQIDVLANDSDPAGQALIISNIATAPNHGATATINDNGTPFIYSDDFIEFSPSGLYAGMEVFQYALCDNGYPSMCDVATVTVTILPNIPPTAVDDDNPTTFSDLPFAIDVLANDYDTDNDNIYLTAIATAPDYGATAVVNDNGTPLNPTDDYIDFTPTGLFVGDETFEYVICDDGVPTNRCDTAAVTVTIVPNNPPVAVDDAASIVLDIPITVDVLANDYDPEAHQTITITAISSAPNHGGTASINDNGTPLDPSDDFIDYDPSGAYSGPETFEYIICDSGLPGNLCDTATVTITLVENTTYPNAVNDAATTTADSPPITIDVLANDSEPIGQVITMTAVSSPNHGGTATINDNGTPLDPTDDYIDYVQSGLFTGVETFTYTLCDNGLPNLCSQGTVSVTVTPNIAPVAVNDTTRVLQDLPKDIDVVVNDYDLSGPLDYSSVSIVSGPSLGTITGIDPITGTITYSPNPGVTGTDVFTYSICDHGVPDPGLCDVASVVITIVSYIPDAEIDYFSAGSFILDMGVLPRSYGSGLRPYGLVYDLVTNHNIPVTWSVRSDKEFSEVDFSHNGKDYSGGPFIIPFEYRSEVIDNVIAAWRATGVVVDTAVSQFSAPVVDVIDGFGNIMIDDENNGIVEPYFQNAGIPSSAYGIGSPTVLNKCEDLFVLPHANPDWPHHNALYEFNTKFGGYVYAACRAVSILESLSDPGDAAIQLNFLSEHGLMCYHGGNCGDHIGQDHENRPTLPYTLDSAYAGMALNQYLDDFSGGTENGSEQWYIPIDGTNWNPGAVNLLSTSDLNNVGAQGTKFSFGYGFDDPDNGMVYYHGGHRLTNGSTEERVAGQRAFFNYMFMASRKPGRDFTARSTVPKCIGAGDLTPLSVELLSGDNGPYTFSWTTTLDGSFSNPISTTPTFTLNSLDNIKSGIITVTIEDGCGRKKIISTPINALYSDTKMKRNTCNAIRDGSIDLDVNTLCEPVSYLWSTGATTQDIDSLWPGTYWVIITNGVGNQYTMRQDLRPDWWNPDCDWYLPVELASFTGSNIGMENHLFWTTLSEINNDRFEVQRSLDGVQFETIGLVDGAGNTADPQDYIFIDDHPYTGKNYYRLKQVDFDGTYDYSQIIVLEVIDLNLHNMMLWPNPTDGMVKVTLSGDLKESLFDLRIYDITGLSVLSEELEIFESTPFNLDLSGLHKGIYLVEIRNGYHQFSHKVIIQ